MTRGVVHEKWVNLSGSQTVVFARAHVPRFSWLSVDVLSSSPAEAIVDFLPAKLRATQQRLNNRPMPVLSGATPQETYTAEINMQ